MQCHHTGEGENHLQENGGVHDHLRGTVEEAEVDPGIGIDEMRIDGLDEKSHRKLLQRDGKVEARIEDDLGERMKVS